MRLILRFGWMVFHELLSKEALSLLYHVYLGVTVLMLKKQTDATAEAAQLFLHVALTQFEDQYGETVMTMYDLSFMQGHAFVSLFMSRQLHKLLHVEVFTKWWGPVSSRIGWWLDR